MKVRDFLDKHGAEIVGILQTNPNYGYRRLSADFHVPERVARKALKSLRSGTPSLDLTHNGNVASIQYSTTGKLPTAEELVELTGLDPADWLIEDITSGAWEVARKNRQTNLKWTDGIMDGEVKDTGQFTRQTLYRVAIRARRKVLQHPQFPTVRGVSVPRWERPATKPRKGEQKTALVIGDTHIGFRRDLTTARLDPFHDRPILDVFLQAVEEYQPHEIILGGDMLDLNEWTTKFIQEPEFAATTQPALEELGWWLRQLREVAHPDCEITWIEGNHDARLSISVITNLKAAYGLKPTDGIENHEALSLPNLLNLDNLAINYQGKYPEGVHWLTPHLRIVHGNVHGKHTASTYATEAQVSTIFHHTHRRDYATQTMQSSRKVVTAVNSGCACRIDGVVPGSHSNVNWQQGFTFVKYTPDDAHARHSIIPVPIYNGTAFLPDREMIGNDYTAELKSAYPSWNW